MPELVFFVGKGGVGKTTISSAYAIHAASRRSAGHILIVSTDPAHSLSDIFDLQIGDRLTRVKLKAHGQLTAWELDATRQFRSFLRRNKEELVRSIERGSLFTGEEISSLLDSALPGLAEISALLAIQEAMQSGKYTRVVVDTAPFGHTLRLFSLPEQLEKLLNVLELASERDQVLAAHFAGVSTTRKNRALDRWRESLGQVRGMLDQSHVYLVTTAETFSLNESARCIEEMRKSREKPVPTAIVLNRAITKAGMCRTCRLQLPNFKRANSLLSRKYPGSQLHVGKDPGFPIRGIAQLKALAESVFAGRDFKLKPTAPAAKAAFPKLKPAKWPPAQKRLTFVLGKGGVGKTTISAALGYNTRRTSDAEMEVCSVDPAPSLDDIFHVPVTDVPRPVFRDEKFRATEFDASALFRSWIANIRATVDASTSTEMSGIHIDLSYERKLFSELLEIVPPGLDEVLAIFRILEISTANRLVIIDMAPTGHALELLRMPAKILSWSRLLLKSLASHRKLALAREASVKIAELEMRARELSRLFQGAESSVYAVMLPELLPDRETERLVHELRALKLDPSAVFVNRVILPDAAGPCARCRSAAKWQASVLTGLKRRLRTTTVYAVPAFDHELAGKQGLQELTRELWELI